MSELTFNIADYRISSPLRAQDRRPAILERNRLFVLSSNSAPRDYETEWLESRPGVVDIRSVRESHRSIPRRGKLLRFSNPASHRVYMMPAQSDSALSADDDPGPLVA